jgi:hypothetical protein
VAGQTLAARDFANLDGTGDMESRARRIVDCTLYEGELVDPSGSGK